LKACDVLSSENMKQYESYCGHDSDTQNLEWSSFGKDLMFSP